MNIEEKTLSAAGGQTVDDADGTIRRERSCIGIRNRILQHMARSAPGAKSVRVILHRWRGVKMGEDVYIGYDSILETSHPELISIGDRAVLSVRTTIIAHFHGATGVHIDEDVFVGPGVIILPNVRIGRGAVVSAGSVVTTSVPAMTVVQGNPARPIAKCGTPLGMTTPMKDFLSQLRPLRRGRRTSKSEDE